MGANYHPQILSLHRVKPWESYENMDGMNVSMVYGRYNELVNGVNKPTNITGGNHIVVLSMYYLITNHL